MTVAIHQPNYFPYLGFFQKLAQADVFIILDNVQFVRGGYMNRNRIKGPADVQWLTVPVAKKGRCYANIDAIVPDWDQPWVRKHVATLKNAYSRSPYFEEIMESVVVPSLTSSESRRCHLADLNTLSIRSICAYLELSVPIRIASALDAHGQSTDRLISLTKAVGGDCYLSGPTGKEYLDLERFEPAGVEIRYAHLQPVEYAQRFQSFTANLSILDALFNCGRDVLEMVNTHSAGGVS